MLTPSKFSLIVAALLAPCLAQAQAREEVSTKVSYADLDVRTAAGAGVLYERIRSAARQICAPAQQEPGRTQLQRDMHERACVTAAVDGGVRRVDLPELTRLAGSPSRLVLAQR